MHLKELVEHMIRFQKDKDVSEYSIIEMYKKQIKHDVISAFQMSKPLIEKNWDLFMKKPSFISFLFSLIDIDLSYDSNNKTDKESLPETNVNTIIDSLKSELNQAKFKAENFEKDFNDCKSSFEDLQRDFFNYKQQSEKQFREGQEQLNILQQELTTVQEHSDMLKKDLDTCLNVSEDLQQKLRTSQAQYNNLLQEYETYKIQAGTLNTLRDIKEGSSFQISQTQFEALEREINELKQSKKKNEDQIKLLNETEIPDLKEEIVRLTASNKEKDEKRRLDTQTINELKEETKKQTQELKLHEKEIEKLNNDISKQLKKLESTTEEYENEKHNLSKKFKCDISQKVTELELQTEKNTKLEKELDDLKRRLEEKSNELALVSQSNAELKIGQTNLQSDSSVSAFIDKFINISNKLIPVDPRFSLEQMLHILIWQYVELFTWIRNHFNSKDNSFQTLYAIMRQNATPSSLTESNQQSSTNNEIPFSLIENSTFDNFLQQIKMSPLTVYPHSSRPDFSLSLPPPPSSLPIPFSDQPLPIPFSDQSVASSSNTYSIVEVTQQRNVYRDLEKKNFKLFKDLEKCKSENDTLKNLLNKYNDLNIERILKLLNEANPNSNSAKNTEFYENAINILKNKSNVADITKIEGLKQDLENLKNQLQKDKKVHDEQLDELQKKTILEKKQLQKELKDCEEKLNEKELVSTSEKRKKSKTKTELNQLHRDKETQAAKISEIEKEKETQTAKISELEKEKETQAAKISELEKEKETQAAKISELEKEKETQAVRLSMIQQKHCNEKEQLQKELKTAHLNDEILNKKVNEISIYNVELQSRLEKCQQENLTYRMRLQSKSDTDNQMMVTDNLEENTLTLKEELDNSTAQSKYSAEMPTKKTLYRRRKLMPKGSSTYSLMQKIKKLNEKIKRLESEKRSLTLVNDDIQKSEKNELDKVNQMLNDEKIRNQALVDEFNKQIQDKNLIINNHDTIVKSKEDIIKIRCGELEQLKQSLDEISNQNLTLQSENEHLNSDCETQLLTIKNLQEINTKKDTDINTLTSTIDDLKEKIKELQSRCKLKRPRGNEKPRSKKLSKQSHENIPSESEFEFSSPNYEWDKSDFQQDKVDYDETFEGITKYKDEDFLTRCIEEKSTLTIELEHCREKLREYQNIIKDAEYVTRTQPEENKLTTQNFKLLFLGFFKYHFKKLLNPDKINLQEEDQKLLNDLKVLMQDLMAGNKCDFFGILCTYVEKQIDSLNSFNMEIDDSEENTVETFLKFTLNQMEDFIKDIKIQQEFENILNMEFSTYTVASRTVFETRENLKNIFIYLKRILDVNQFKEMELKLESISNLINKLYPTFVENVVYVAKHNFLEHLIDKSIGHLKELAPDI